MPDKHMIITEAQVAPTEPVEAQAQAEVASNYLFWQQQGAEWADEYDTRKKLMPKYHLQELMLTEYFAHSGPARVLEYGCGVGRHLSYLHQLPGIDIYGYDQSANMVSGFLRWTSQQWIDEHVTIGAPVGTLPFPDNSFDIVYTTEVLVHVRPEDVDKILSELLRIARWQVLHLETSPHYPLVTNAHDGCWYHDIMAAYERLGVTCEILPYGYNMHTPYRVMLEPGRKAYSWPPVLLAKMRRMESDLEEGTQRQLDGVRGPLEARIGELEQQAGGLQGELAGQAQRAEAAEARGQALEAQVAQLQPLLEARSAELQAAEERAALAASQAQGAQEALEAQLTALREEMERQNQEAQETREHAWALEQAVGQLEQDLAARTQEAQEARVTSQDLEQQLLNLRGAMDQQVRRMQARQKELGEQALQAEAKIFNQDAVIKRQHSIIKNFIAQIHSELSRTR